jgi:hypothetical protein
MPDQDGQALSEVRIMLFDGIELIDSSTAVNLTIDNGPNFPSGTKGELFFKDGVGLFVFDGATWVRVQGQTAANCVTGNFPGDVKQVAGTARFYPRDVIAVTSISAWLSSNATTDVVATVRKNGNVVTNITIKAGDSMTKIAANFSVLTTDYLTMDVVSGVGKDLTIRLDY